MTDNSNIDFLKVAAFIIALVSLLWNIGNTLYTRSIGRRNRSLNIKLEEFRASVVAPIRVSLDAIDEIGSEVRTLAISDCTLKQLRATAISLNKSIIDKLNKLYDALDDANKSVFADGDDWLDILETKQDTILQHLDAANNPVNSADRAREALLLCHSEIRGLKSVVNDQIGDQINRLSA